MTNPKPTARGDRSDHEQCESRSGSRGPRTGSDARSGLDRREFITASASGLAVALAPACHRSAGDGGSPGGVGGGDPDAAAAASGLRIGTELFQESVYAQPVVASNVVGSHALIEGVRRRLRVQSDLTSANPTEAAFLETGYHHGLPELIQIELDPDTGEPEVVHYYHPFKARGDGARTDGLVRKVILSTADGLVAPTRVMAVTGSLANRFAECCGDWGGFSNLSYLVFVEDVHGSSVGKLLIGSVAEIIPDSQQSPIAWAQTSLDGELLQFNTGGDYAGADKLTGAAWVSPALDVAPTYQPEQQAEHVVLYMTAGADPSVVVLTLVDTGSITPQVLISRASLPSDAESELRLAHVDWTPGQSNNLLVNGLCMLTSTTESNGTTTYVVRGLNAPQASTQSDQIVGGAHVHFRNLQGTWQLDSFGVSASQTENGTYALDYTKIRDVHTLHTTFSGTARYHVKLLNVEGRGACILVLGQDVVEVYVAGGHFPLQFPDDAGLGDITALSGGTSRFGGFRFIASDSDGNVFLLRQRRDESIDTPYAPPIYGINTATGQARTTWTSTPDPLPSGTSASSNLHSLSQWFEASTDDPQLPGYNFLLDAALAFGTDASNASQATWLGNTYVAAYALRHMTSDSEHVAITQAQAAGGGDLEYRALAVFKDPVAKTWHQRQIAAQILPQGTGLQESGNHYQTTITPINAGGQPVSLLTTSNKNLQIEVRADTPTTVIDETNNLYYDVDRYTSFFASPDPTTGKLILMVKAESFGQMLYVRLVDTHQLQRSASDPALIMSSSDTTYPWTTINMAQQAQQRMGISSSSASACRPEDGVYVSNCTLSDSDDANSWQTKGSFTADSGTFASLASYLNTSGQNLGTTSDTLGLAAGEAIDPLYALTTQSSPGVEAGPTSSTHYDFHGGLVTYTTGATAPAPGELGGLFSSISHALHDALHWLQHVTEDVYQELASDGVKLFNDVDSVTVTVAADIMKQVNGVEQELQEVVTTVEEYASIVANVIVTIVEHTFIYLFIELLIDLISLFIHLQDIKDLQASLKSRFDDLMSGSGGNVIPLPSASTSAATGIDRYLGPDTDLDDALFLSSSQLGQVPQEIVQVLLDAVLANPIVAKIQQKIMSAVGELFSDIEAALPVEFSVDQAIVSQLIQDFEMAREGLEGCLANLGIDAIVDLFEALAASVSDPKQTLQNLETGLANVFKDAATDILDPTYQFIDQVAHQAPTIIKELVDQDPYISVNLTAIADLCVLLGLGSIADGTSFKLTLSGSDAVFFPMASALWVAVYQLEGKSIKSVDDLAQTVSATEGGLGSTTTQRWNFGRLAVDAVMQELIAFAFITGAASTEDVPTARAASSWFSFARWLNEVIYTAQAPASSGPEFAREWNLCNLGTRLMTSFLAACVSVPGSQNDQGGGWSAGTPRTTDLLQLLNTAMSVASIGVGTYAVASNASATGTQIAVVVGQDIARLQIVGMTIFNLFKTQLEAYGEYFALFVIGTPAGFGVQMEALAT